MKSVRFGRVTVVLPMSAEERAKAIAKFRVRRFDAGSSEAMIQEAIDALGMRLAANHGSKGYKPYRLWNPGAKKPRIVTHEQLMEVVDGWRRRHGKQPLRVK